VAHLRHGDSYLARQRTFVCGVAAELSNSVVLTVATVFANSKLDFRQNGAEWAFRDRVVAAKNGLQTPPHRFLQFHVRGNSEKLDWCQRTSENSGCAMGLVKQGFC